MTFAADVHNRVILDQFTRQAGAFSKMQGHSPQLILNAAQIIAKDKVLDVACGPGLMACEFAGIADQVTGIDLAPAMIERARALQATLDRRNITWLVGDVLRLPFPDASFSVVFTRYSLHHFLDPMAVLTEMVRVCADGERVIVVDVFTSGSDQAELFNRMEKLRDPSHVRALSLEELVGLCHRVGLKEVQVCFYKHEFELEQVLQGSFPNPGDADRVRQLFVDDLDVNRLGLGAWRKNGQIHFAYPIAILIGRKA